MSVTNLTDSCSDTDHRADGEEQWNKELLKQIIYKEVVLRLWGGPTLLSCTGRPVQKLQKKNILSAIVGKMYL